MSLNLKLFGCSVGKYDWNNYFVEYNKLMFGLPTKLTIYDTLRSINFQPCYIQAATIWTSQAIQNFPLKLPHTTLQYSNIRLVKALFFTSVSIAIVCLSNHYIQPFACFFFINSTNLIGPTTSDCRCKPKCTRLMLCVWQFLMCLGNW